MQTNVSVNFEINKRILQLIDYLGITKGSFSKEIGISSSRMANITTNRNKPDSQMLQFILNKYSFVSAEWLLLGEGEMISNSRNDNKSKPKNILDESIHDDCKRCLENEKHIKNLEHTIDVLNNQLEDARKDKDLYRQLLKEDIKINKQAS
jgi:hypothetical protein